MSPRYESAKINTEDAAKPKKKTPPPIPPKPKELKKYVIPKAYPGVPQRRSSKSTDSKFFFFLSTFSFSFVYIYVKINIRINYQVVIVYLLSIFKNKNIFYILLI